MFNDCIVDLGLRELERVGVRFTWINCRGNGPDSRGEWYKKIGQSLSYDKLVHTMYEFRPLSWR